VCIEDYNSSLNQRDSLANQSIDSEEANLVISSEEEFSDNDEDDGGIDARSQVLSHVTRSVRKGLSSQNQVS
jgi:hypothetical protein